MARTKLPERRREELLDAAEASFLQRGIAATTVDHITSGAGVAKGTFYLYFRSRADVVAGVQQRYGERFVRALVAALDAAPADDWGGKLDACVAAVLRNHQAQRALHDVLFLHDPPSGDDADAGLDEILEVFRRLLDDGVAAGAYRVADVGTTAMLLFNTVHGIFVPSWTGSAAIDEEALVAAASTLFRRAVGLAVA